MFISRLVTMKCFDNDLLTKNWNNLVQISNFSTICTDSTPHDCCCVERLRVASGILVLIDHQYSPAFASTALNGVPAVTATTSLNLLHSACPFQRSRTPPESAPGEREKMRKSTRARMGAHWSQNKVLRVAFHERRRRWWRWARFDAARPGEAAICCQLMGFGVLEENRVAMGAESWTRAWKWGANRSGILEWSSVSGWSWLDEDLWASSSFSVTSMPVGRALGFPR